MRQFRFVLAVLSAFALAACGSRGTNALPSSTTSSSVPSTGASAPTTSTSSPVASIAPYLALWPFRSAGEVQSWQQAYQSNGEGSWHLDAATTALDFTMSYLGLNEINVVVSMTRNATGAHAAVGYRPTSSHASTAAVIHLVRWGTGNDAPWEVVGTDDTTFSLTAPAYGATVSSPFRVGGAITGVDESIRVAVLQPSSVSPLGTFCCQAAGGNASPWSATVSFANASDPIVTVVATTGGHVQAVERFTVTGVHPASN